MVKLSILYQNYADFPSLNLLAAPLLLIGASIVGDLASLREGVDIRRVITRDVRSWRVAHDAPESRWSVGSASLRRVDGGENAFDESFDNASAFLASIVSRHESVREHGRGKRFDVVRHDVVASVDAGVSARGARKSERGARTGAGEDLV